MEEDTIVEKIIGGKANLGDCDLNSDFDHDEIRSLLEAGIIGARDLPDGLASDMILDGTLSYDEYPFEKFTPYEQVRQLEQGAVRREDFKAKAELEDYDGNDWLLLLDVWPELDGEAPWERIREEACARCWFDFLSSRPEYAQKADWKKLFEAGKTKEYFAMLAKQPSLFAYCPDKRKLLEADCALWVELLIKQPNFAEIYPMEGLNGAEEAAHLLLHRPELAEKLNWDKDNAPVKLFIANGKPERMTFSPELAWFISTESSPVTEKILREILLYQEKDAQRYANLIAHSSETFAGIYSTRAAEAIVRNFQAAAAQAGLPLTLRMEPFSNRRNG